MATVPQFEGPDGQVKEDIVFSTTKISRFFSGVIGSDTVDLQVSIRGGNFTSDPDFVFFEGTSFTIPNPSSFPEGLDLVDGQNEILLRAIDTTGSVSANASATVRLVQESDLGLVVQAPTNISLERKDDSVTIAVEGVSDSRFVGVNFYASSSPGGGVNGYLPINVNLVTEFTTEEEEILLGNLPVDSDVVLGTDGNQAADPLQVRVQAFQQDEDETVLQTEFNEILEVPEDVRRLRYSVDVSRVREVSTYYFDHSRSADQRSNPATIPQSEFSALTNTDPIYYVATAVFFDSSSQIELESPFTPELQGTPLTVTVEQGAFPVVSRETIVQDMALSINRARPELRIDQGSVTRDTVIDPASLELSQTRFILDFLHRSQSPSSLLRIDDPSLSGTSVPVAQSNYKLSLKQAFKLQQDSDVQSLVDQAFELQASRYGIARKSGSRSRGEATFFTTRRPTETISIPIGTVISGGGRRFRTTEAAAITIENIASFFSGTTGRYSVRVSIQAEEAGSGGNLAPNQIRTIVQGPTNISVVNENRTFGGRDIESNRDLANRYINRIASVDSGTLAGINRIAVGVPGVSEVQIVTPTEDLMQRDLDGGVHKGGKVDIWVRGTSVNTITDAFAFSFTIAQDVQFEVIGDPLDLRFRALDSRLTEDNPIIEMLDIPSFGFGLRNASTGDSFVLTNVTVEDFNLIKLDTSQTQPSLDLTDVVQGDFRFRSSNEFVFPRQPVTRINSLVGTVTGSVDPSAYVLKRLEDPLQKGRSTEAGDSIQVVDSQDSSITIPSGDPITVTNESHVIIGETTEFLNNLGVNPVTIRVYNNDKTVEYDGPFSPTGTTVDFTIIEGDETTPAGIRRTETGDILSGQEILIDYQHDENFVVSYDSNFLVTAVQEDIDESKHVTADILVKESVSTTVDLAVSVVTNRGENPNTVDGRIRTNLTNYFRGLGLGDALRPSDVVGILEGTQGVSYVVLPLTRMVRAEGSLIIREPLVVGQASDYTLIEDWSTDSFNVYLLEDSLVNATTNGGGSQNEFRGVFQNDIALDLQVVLPATALGEAEGRAFIIGDSGLVIPNISDDVTLENEGADTDQEISEDRKTRTGNRIIVSLPVGQTPDEYEYAVTYLVGQDSGVKAIEPGSTESLSLFEIDINYDEER